MSNLAALHLLSAGSGVLTLVLVLTSGRLGTCSLSLAGFLLPAALAAGLLATGDNTQGLGAEEPFRGALALLVISAPSGLTFSLTFRRDEVQNRRSQWRHALGLTHVLGLLLVLAFYFLEGQSSERIAGGKGHVVLGMGGYATAFYLLIVSVLVLASCERTVRSAEEHVRWEIKFLMLGLATSFATYIYLACNVLLCSPRYSVLPHDSMHVFPVMFLLSCLLVLASWRRISGGGRVLVSQSVIFSSITFLSVGSYLILSSVVAQWARLVTDERIEVQAVVFLLLALVLAGILLSTSFRHRVRHWIRRNIFAGRYDYRLFWMEANEKVRASDPPETAASALGELIHCALGAIDVTVWVRGRDPGKLRRLAAQGPCADGLAREASRIIDKLEGVTDPIPCADFARTLDPTPERHFLERTGTSLLVPLWSGGETVGVITVGSDRSGRPYDQEAREFLRVLAAHAAGEFHKSELLRTLVEAKEAEAFRSFSTFLLHDLKNFASTLSLIASNAVRLGGNPNFQKDAFQAVFSTSEKMKRLCNSLRTFSGSLAGNKKPDDLNEVVEEVARNMTSTLSTPLKLELGKVPELLIDRDEIARVLQNLILNAQEATGGGGLIVVRTSSDEGKVGVSVVDNGEGIAAEFLEKELFVPFHTTKTHGLGIGLFQSRRIIEAHGGAIRIESKKGEGTTVHVTFPAPHDPLHRSLTACKS